MNTENRHSLTLPGYKVQRRVGRGLQDPRGLGVPLPGLGCLLPSCEAERQPHSSHHSSIFEKILLTTQCSSSNNFPILCIEVSDNRLLQF